MSRDLYRNEGTTKLPRAAIVTGIEQTSDVCIRPVEGVAIGVSKSPFFILLLPLPDASPFLFSLLDVVYGYAFRCLLQK